MNMRRDRKIWGAENGVKTTSNVPVTIEVRSHSVQARAFFPENGKHMWFGGGACVTTGVGDVDIMEQGAKVKKGTHRVMFSRGVATASKVTLLCCAL